MKTRVLTLGQLCLPLVFCLALTSCNKDDYYEKEFLDSPYQQPSATGSAENGSQGGEDAGGTTQGGVSGGGVAGGTSGGTTGGGTVGGTTTGGTTYVDETETFQQAASQTKKLDIVWIIDNSGSMADEQAALGANFSAFIQDFMTKNVDFKMAITTTDTTDGQKGVMVSGSDTKLTSTAAALNAQGFLDDFNGLIKVGTRGSGNEKGLEASEGFMQLYGNSFLRSDAYLAVVIVSDEEDQSPRTPAEYSDYLKTFKSEAGLVKVYTIVDTGLTNVGSGGITTGFQRYADASVNTAGTVGNIRNDFYHVLTDMGESIINLLDSFALAYDPNPSSLKVYVNNILNSDYSFDASSRSIKFTAGHLPPVGAQIKVEYQR